MNIYKCLNYGKKNYTPVFSKAFEGCFQFILREHLYLNFKWWTNSYFIQVMIKNHANLVSAGFEGRMWDLIVIVSVLDHSLSFYFNSWHPRHLGTTENATFAHFMKKSMHLKTGFLLHYQVFFLTTNRKRFAV